MGAGLGRDDAGTAARILDVAERLVQERGFNGFSYADISAELGITKAALHYHFAGKADLGLALITRYTTRFTESLTVIDRSGNRPSGRLARYADLYLQVLRKDRMCLCGMLAAEFPTLPPAMRAAVTRFFEENERWLEKLLDDGRHDGSLRFGGTARDTARMVTAGLEGAVLIARPYGDAERFQVAAAALLASLAPAPVIPSAS